MSPEKSHNDDAVIQNDNLTDDIESKLIQFDEKNNVTPGKDINTKITALDTDLAQLRAELSAINNSVEEGLDRLGDTDTDLTAKVSETYKRLGEIDNAYKALIQISSRIDADIQKLNGDVSAVAEQSASGIKSLERSTVAQSNEFAQKNEQVVTRVNHLVETSKLTGDLLSQKIQVTTDKMLQFEKQVITEIENLSNKTQDRADTIEESVATNKAKILKLQSVDEAIIKRATTLEISASELTVKGRELQASVEQLQLSTSVLSTGLGELREQTRALEDITHNHGALITGLQKASYEISDKLALLAGRETRHFNIVTTGFLLLLIVTVVLYFSQQGQFDAADAKIAGNSEKVDSQIAYLQQDVENKIALVEHKMKDMQDQVQSVDIRLTNESPFSRIGSDNIIHGTQWIAGLPQENYTVQLAFSENKNAMYELAMQYNYYLNDSLSYYETDDKGSKKYVLLSGNYATQQQAVNRMRSLPRYINRQQPVVRKLGDVQKNMTQKM